MNESINETTKKGLLFVFRSIMRGVDGSRQAGIISGVQVWSGQVGMGGIALHCVA